MDKRMLNRITDKLVRIKFCHLLWMSVLASEVFTAIIVSIMNILFYGRVLQDYLITGAVTAFLVSLVVVFVLLSLFKRLRETDDALKEAYKAFTSVIDSKEEERNRLLNVLDASLNEIYTFDPDTFRFKYVNAGALRNLGYSMDELKEMTPLDLKPEFNEGSFRNLIAPLLKHEKEKLVFQTVHRRADGSLYPVEVHLQLIGYDGERVFLAVILDITEKKRLEDHLRQAQKMEAIGNLAGGIAHDFNNILTAIMGYGGLLRINIGKDSPLIPQVETILKSAEKAADLTRQLLAFSRKQIMSLKPVNLNDIIKDIEKLLRRLIGEDIEIKIMLSEKDLTIMADSGQICQVLINLVTNARDVMHHGGRLTITTDTFKIDSGFIKEHGFGKRGRYACLSVTDTGEGMDERTKEKIFEPFFTTKEVGKGTGLGLAVAHGIVSQHNGYIDVQSELGKGTTFKIYIPLIKKETEVAEPITLTLMGGTETILLAEDDEVVRTFEKETLERSGYSVIEATDGEDAADKFMENKEKIHLLLFDVVMPKKSGKDAYDEIKKIKSDVKIIFMSGYTADIIHKKGIFEEGIPFLFKPISPDEILKKVREVLDK